MTTSESAENRVRLRFQADADLNQVIVNGVIRLQPEIDIQTANTLNLEGLKDVDVLKLAAQHERILISHDHRTMPFHFAEFITTHNSPGVIIIVQHLPIRQAIQEIINIWQQTTPQDWMNRIAYLPL